MAKMRKARKAKSKPKRAATPLKLKNDPPLKSMQLMRHSNGKERPRSLTLSDASDCRNCQHGECGDGPLTWGRGSII